MVLVVFSDVHGNYDALECALKQMENYTPDYYVCLGDIVGYGPEPVRCMNRIKQLPNCIIISGNHEKILLRELTTDGCSNLGKMSAEWTKDNVSEELITEIASFPEYIIRDDIGFYHSFSKEEDKFPYLNALEDILECSPQDGCSIQFYGHTHRPRITSFSGEDVMIETSVRMKLCNTDKYCINVGSIGQMRDRHTEFSFAVLSILEEQQYELEIVRGTYDSYEAYCKIRDRMQNKQIADYLIRESQIREEYESQYNSRIAK